MAGKKNKAEKPVGDNKPGALPKSISGVKLPKSIRAKLTDLAKHPAVADLLAAGLVALAARLKPEAKPEEPAAAIPTPPEEPAPAIPTPPEATAKPAPKRARKTATATAPKPAKRAAKPVEAPSMAKTSEPSAPVTPKPRATRRTTPKAPAKPKAPKATN